MKPWKVKSWIKIHEVEPVLLPPHEDVHALLGKLAPLFAKLPQLAGLEVTFKATGIIYDPLAAMTFMVDEGRLPSGNPEASLNSWTVLPEDQFDPAALFRLTQTVADFRRLPVLLSDIAYQPEQSDYPDMTVLVMRSCLLIQHADSYSLLTAKGFPRDGEIEAGSWLAKMLGTVAAAPAGSNHARLKLAEDIRTDIARANAARNNALKLIDRRFGVRTVLPDAGHLASIAIGPDLEGEAA